MIKLLKDATGGKSMENLCYEIIELLRIKNLTLSSAESCTGGLISKMITDVAGCSDVFEGGVV